MVAAQASIRTTLLFLLRQCLMEIPVATRKKNIDFEQSLSQLETLVASLESGDMSLEDSLKAFESGIKITRDCQEALKEAEQRVEILIRNRAGELQASSFDVQDSD